MRDRRDMAAGGSGRAQGAANVTEVRPWWARAGVRAGGVVAAAVTAVLIGYFTQAVNWVTGAVTTSGPPVAARVEVRDGIEDVTLPAAKNIPDADLARLDKLPPEQQAGYLEQHDDGIIAGTRSVVLTLRGNRTHQVRITDLEPVETCGAPSRGTLARLITGRGGGVDSTRVNIDIGRVAGEPYQVDATTGEDHPYFPDHTITLDHDEEIVVVIDLNPVERGSLCRTHLEMTVWDGDAKATQRISNDGKDFEVMQFEPDVEDVTYSAVYLGCYLCHDFVLVARGRGAEGPAACGPGNAAQ